MSDYCRRDFGAGGVFDATRASATAFEAKQQPSKLSAKREREKERQRDRETERKRERGKERKRDRETERKILI